VADDALDLEGGDDAAAGAAPEGEKPKRGSSRRSGRPPRENVSNELKGSISGGLNELAEWLDDRDEELAGTLRESAPRIAEFLAVHAARRAKVARGVKYVFAKGGPFAALRAFGPLLRELRERVKARSPEEEEQPETDEQLGVEHGAVIPHA